MKERFFIYSVSELSIIADFAGEHSGFGDKLDDLAITYCYSEYCNTNTFFNKVITIDEW